MKITLNGFVQADPAWSEKQYFTEVCNSRKELDKAISTMLQAKVDNPLANITIRIMKVEK